MDSLLNQFKIAREARNMTLEDVSRELKIPHYYLEAIENLDFHSLPETVYAVGFIKSYAKFLVVDHVNLLSSFKESRSVQKNLSVETKKQPQVDVPDIGVAFLKNITDKSSLCALCMAVIILILMIVGLL